MRQIKPYRVLAKETDRAKVRSHRNMCRVNVFCFSGHRFVEISENRVANKTWSEVDDFISTQLISPEERQAETICVNQEAGLPAIDISAPQGKFLQLLASASGARNILEIGTLGGFSTIWLARAVGKDGRVISIDVDSKHIHIARQNIAREGLADRVDLRLGAAVNVLGKLEEERIAPFDFCFIDADKANNAHYFDWAAQHSRIGGLIVVDNVICAGAVADDLTKEENAISARRLFGALSRNPRVSATAIQTVGLKGWDGMLIAEVCEVVKASDE